MSSRVLSSFKANRSSSRLRRPQLSRSSSPAESHSPPKKGMIKRKPPQDLSESEIRAKVREHFNKSKSPQQDATSTIKNQKMDRESAKKKAHDKVKENMGKGVKVKKPEVNANDPNNSNTSEKIKDALNNDLVNFSSKERAALTDILGKKES